MSGRGRNGKERKRRKGEGAVLTHVNLIGQPVVDDFEESDDVWMSALFHDGDFLANFVFCCAHTVCEAGVGGLREGTFSELGHAV